MYISRFILSVSGMPMQSFINIRKGFFVFETEYLNMTTLYNVVCPMMRSVYVCDGKF
jgi:hypothetical protein